MAEKKVRMVHPKLPGVVIEVRESAAAARQRAGWKPAKETRSAATAAVSKKES